MGLHIIRPGVEELAQELANFAHEDLTDAVEAALSERLDRLKSLNERREIRNAELLEWFAELDARPKAADPRTLKQWENEEMYDEWGQPIG